MRALDKDLILSLFEKLNSKLNKKEIIGEMTLYGGVVMCLCLEARESTHDIDAWFMPKIEILKCVEEISYEEGLNKDWLNDAVKGFISENDDCEIFLEYSNLKIFKAKDDYLLAMKLLSCRLENSNEINDIKFLLNYLKIQTIEQAENILLRYFPLNLVTPKIQYVLEEIFNNN